MKPLEIKEIFKYLAKDYDKIIREGRYKAYDIMALWALRNTKKKRAMILDLGCGTGLSSLRFLRNGHKVVGIDISKEMLDEAKKYPFEELICQSLNQPLKVKDNYFDVIMLVGTIDFVKNPNKLLKQAYKKLKSNGIFLVTVPQKLPNTSKLIIKSYTRNEIELIFLKSDFKIIESKSFFGFYKRTENGIEAVKYFGYLLKKRK